jgi:hypothetical protein
MAYCKNDEDTFFRMFEVLIRGFLITEPFRAEVKHEELYSEKKNAAALVEEAYKRFLTAVKEAGPFFLEFERLWYKLNNQKNIPVFFEEVYKEAYQPMCCIWDDVKKIYEDLTEGVDPQMEEQEELVRNIQEGLGSGRPLVRILYPKRGANGASGERSRLDPFFLIRHVIKEHIRGFFGEGVIDPTKHVLFVPRDSKGEPVRINLPEGKKLHEQLLDRRLNDVVSVSPETRKKFMRNRITVIKTLWDISTNLRARRMKDLLNKTWSE